MTRNRKADLIECLNSVAKSEYPGGLEIIVVDNGSTDGTEAVVRQMFPDLEYIYNNVNLGLVGGRKMCQSRSHGEFLVFLDSDTVAAKDMIQHLVDFARRERVGIVVPKMYSYREPKRLWFAGAKFNLLTSRAENIGAWEIDTGKYDRVSEVSHGPTCFVVRRELAERIRGHDPIFFQSYADTDFAFRIKKLGYLNLYCPSAVLYHKTPTLDGNASLRGLGMDTPLRAYYYARNKTLFMKRHSSRMNFIAFLAVFLPIITTMYFYRIAEYGGGTEYLSRYLLGFGDGLKFVFSHV